MAHRFIGEGTKHSYDELIAQLEEGHMLVATWLLDPIYPQAEVIKAKVDFERIVRDTRIGYNIELRFFSSSHEPGHFFDYNTLTEDGERGSRPLTAPRTDSDLRPKAPPQPAGTQMQLKESPHESRNGALPQSP